VSGWENMQWRRRGVAVGKEGSGQRQDTREKISRVVHDVYHWALHSEEHSTSVQHSIFLEEGLKSFKSCCRLIMRLH